MASIRTELLKPKSEFHPVLFEKDGHFYIQMNGKFIQIYSIQMNNVGNDNGAEFFHKMTNRQFFSKIIENVDLSNTAHLEFFAYFMLCVGLHTCFKLRAFTSVHPMHFSFEKSKCTDDMQHIMLTFAFIALNTWNIDPSDDQINDFMSNISIPLEKRFYDTFGSKDNLCYRLNRPSDNVFAAREWLRVFSDSDKKTLKRLITMYYACESFVHELSMTYHKNGDIKKVCEKIRKNLRQYGE